MSDRQKVLILDFGSQYTQLIARRVRELHVYCEIRPCFDVAPGADLSKVLKSDVGAIILSGGPSSVYDAAAPTIDPELFDSGIPILGICYGLQIMAQTLGGKVERSQAREYGVAELDVVSGTGIFSQFMIGDSLQVWMSHGDRIASLPPGFEIQGVSANTPFCAVADASRRIFGLQFHPEVSHTPDGAAIIRSFICEVAGMHPDWTPNTFVDDAVSKVSEAVGDKVAICGLSGGVDSTVAAVICHRAIGDRLRCVFVDNGLLRQGEFTQVMKTYKDRLGLPVLGVDASSRFLDALRGVTDPEQKRKIIGRVFIEVFDEEATKMGGADFLVQGTLYPDVIESTSVRGPSAVIKSHHNVGGLPAHMKMALVEPLRELFKDEVRDAGVAMGIPAEFTQRQPFPGPGLAIRCVGEVTAARLHVLRQADVILEAEVRAANEYSALWQCFCVLLPVRSVGVMGDTRTYDETCVVRAVQSMDGMTADWARLPHDLLSRISNRIINEVEGINRVLYDISSKPPATIEFE